MSENIEHRSSQRFQANERALILIPNEQFYYHIVDIGPKGMAFRYYGNESINKKVAEIDIFHNEQQYLANIPIEVMSDILMEDGLLSLRRCGVKFDDISPAQQKQLNEFIEEHACCKA